MPTARRLATSALAFFGVLALAAAPDSEVPDDLERLRSMPLEYRTRLAEQLRAFDLMDRGEQEAVRALDRKLLSEPEENRAIYYAVLRRYHAWVQSLSEIQRNELSMAPPSKRMALVTKFRPDRTAPDAADPSFYHYADFGGASPFDLARQIKLWLALSDEQKAEVAKLADNQRLLRLTQLAHETKTAAIARPSTSETDAIYDRAKRSGKYPFLQQAEKTEETRKAEKKDAKKQSRIKHRFVDNYYFVEHPPKKVSPERLLQFDRALPAWVRGQFDTLPPEEARRRLTILYRLVFPPGKEFEPAAARGDSATKAPAAVPKAKAPGPPAKPSAAPGPF